MTESITSNTLNMNIEKNRLETFVDWPSDSVVSAGRIAKAGFFSTGGQTVMCFSCGLRISDWNYGDQVMARHRVLSPQCAFVLEPNTSGNIPDVVPTTSSTVCLSNSLSTEQARLATFENWRKHHIVTPERLAKAGFFYTNERDKTECAFCHGALSVWEEDDDPDVRHQQFFPNCSFVQSVINRRIVETSKSGPSALNTNLNLVALDNLQELGVNTHKAPKKLKYATLESRVGTFDTWPKDLIQTPNTLAQAGFYYEGKDDLVRCFHCDGGLTHWDPEDDPWTEHARWFPKCAYVQLIKGHDFIAACSLDSTTPKDEEKKLKNVKKMQKKSVTDKEIQEQMRTAQVIMALEVGIHVGRIKQAIREKLETTGTGFSTADAVIEAALGIQHEEEDSNEFESRFSQEVAQTLNDYVEKALDNVDKSAPVDKDDKSKVKETVAPISRSSSSFSLEEENRMLKEAKLCKICMDNEVGIVFLPCGHLTTCVNCAPNLQDCPLCRSPIKATVRTFLS